MDSNALVPNLLISLLPLNCANGKKKPVARGSYRQDQQGGFNVWETWNPGKIPSRITFRRTDHAEIRKR